MKRTADGLVLCSSAATAQTAMRMHAASLTGYILQERRGVLADALEVASFRQGQVVYQQGEEADSFYLIATGTATAQGTGGEATSLRMGGYFGERALHTAEPRCV